MEVLLAHPDQNEFFNSYSFGFGLHSNQSCQIYTIYWTKNNYLLLFVYTVMTFLWSDIQYKKINKSFHVPLTLNIFNYVICIHYMCCEMIEAVISMGLMYFVIWLSKPYVSEGFNVFPLWLDINLQLLHCLNLEIP